MALPNKSHKRHSSITKNTSLWTQFKLLKGVTL